MTAAWQYRVQRITTGQWLHHALPLRDVTPTRSLSAPSHLSGTLSSWQVDELAEDGLPLLDPWSTAIWADDGNEIRGGILHSIAIEGDSAVVDVRGLSAYPAGLPWYGPAWSATEVDPLDVVRHCWADVQAAPGGNLGLTVDPLTSPVRVGNVDYWHHEESGQNSAASRWNKDAAPDAPDAPPQGWRYVTAEPIILSAWETPDVGDTISRMLDQAQVDYVESTVWAGPASDMLEHRLILGRPLGVRRDNLRLVVGENVAVLPGGLVDGDAIADTVMLRGAGEGSGMILGSASVPTHRLRRVAVVTDRAVTSTDQAANRARSLLPRMSSPVDIDTLTLIDHPHAPLGSFDVGDWLPLIATGGWMTFDGWVRVLQITINPTATATMTLTVQPEGVSG